MPQEIHPFAINSSFSADRSETVIAGVLAQWQSLAASDRELMTGPSSAFRTELNSYLSNAVSRSRVPGASAWWCDGVLALIIENRSPGVFIVAGSVYWAGARPHQTWFFLAPFEIEFTLSSAEEPVVTRAVVRFGSLDQKGAVMRTPIEDSEVMVAYRRPTCDRDWAVVVEVS